MSNKIKCPECGVLIDVDEQIRKNIETEVRKENNEREREKITSGEEKKNIQDNLSCEIKSSDLDV